MRFGLLVCISVSACTPHIYSPPARGMPLETVRALQPGQNAVMLEGGPTEALLWGPRLIAGSARYRLGIEEHVESSVEVTLLRVTNSSDVKTHRNAYSARLGTKYEAEPWLAVGFGVGGGGSAAGGFVSPDLGVIMAYENPYAIPFAALRAFASVPIAPRTIDLGAAELEVSDEPGDQHVHGAPRPSFGYSLSTGIRVPLCLSLRPTHSLYLALNAGQIFDRKDQLATIGLSGGMEVVF